MSPYEALTPHGDVSVSLGGRRVLTRQGVVDIVTAAGMTAGRTVVGRFSMPPAAATAAALQVDQDRRLITGLILPWNVYGLTSAGRLRVNPDVLTLPDDVSRVKLFDKHSDEGGQPVGYATSLWSDSVGLYATFRVSDSPEGDRALSDANPQTPVKDGLSVEVYDLILENGDTVTSGSLSAVAQVPIPAFDDARVSAVAASQHHPNGRTPVMDPCSTCGLQHDAETSCRDAVAQATTPPAATPPADPAATPDPAAPAATAASSTPAATAARPGRPAAAATSPAAAPAGLSGAPSVQRGSRPGDAIGSLDEFYAALAARAQGRRLAPAMTAALSDITQTAVGVDVAQPAWVGQLWDHVSYQRKIVPLLGTPRNLTSYKVTGWRWADGGAPEVDTWAGDKNAVPSNAVSTDPVTITAKRLAGAHDIDRKFRDFNDTEFFQAYYEAMTESYARKSDAALLTDLLAAATDEATPAYEGFLGAIAAGVEMIEDETGADSTFVIANKADLIPFVLGTTNLDLPAFLESIGVDVKRIVTHSGMTAGHVLVGTAPAASFYELQNPPIRVEAIDMVKGGVDDGVFGYYADMVHNAAGLIDVTIDPVGA